MEKKLFDQLLDELNKRVNTLFFIFIDTNNFYKFFDLL